MRKNKVLSFGNAKGAGSPNKRWPKTIDQLSADTRPSENKNHEEAGHYERDLIVGKDHQGYLLTIVDRKTRFTLIKKIERPRAETVHHATLQAFRSRPLKSLTNDNGVEFAAYKKTSAQLQVPIYFTRPYASWERGTVENTDKLIRQYFRKQQNLKDLTHAQIKMVQNRLNHRPRELLGFRSPAEAAA